MVIRSGGCYDIHMIVMNFNHFQRERSYESSYFETVCIVSDSDPLIYRIKGLISADV